MAIDGDALREQMKNVRSVDGRFERLVNGEWVPWPVLRLDKLATDDLRRAAARQVSQPTRFRP